MEDNTVTAAEDTEMEDCDGQNVVTMMDVLKEQEDFENNANAVLGASDEKNCTYSKGYIKRQAIYACMTCCSEAKDDPSKRAGVCLACSLTCHENHELIELYTKRNFRCDCGNPKFNSNPCQYTATKSDLNENNEYNQNFSGLYCVCHRPYPDPESSIEDEMIQCIICEDWLHATHLEATVPSNDQYSEMICKGCMEKNPFLHDYSNLAVNVQNNIDVVVDATEVTTLNGNYKDNKIDKLVTHAKEIHDKCETKESQNSDTTKEKAKLEDEFLEDRLLADPEEENKLKVKEMDGDYSEKQDKKIDTSQSVSIEDDKNKEQLQQPSADVMECDVKDCESNGDVVSNAHSEAIKDDKKTDSKMSGSNEEEKVNTDENTMLLKNTEEKSNLVPNDLDVSTETPNDASKTKLNISDETNIKANIENNTDMETENTNEGIKYEDTSEFKRKLSNEENTVESTIAGKKVKYDSGCIRPIAVNKILKGATFWPSDFRQKLCTCHECLTMYKDLSVLFLTDFDDTVTAYESLGEEKERIEGKPISQYEKGLQALSSLDRVQQINALTEYNKMKDKLLDFLKTFKERKEVVKEEDIKEFFAGMKPKREPDGVYFCR